MSCIRDDIRLDTRRRINFVGLDGGDASLILSPVSTLSASIGRLGFGVAGGVAKGVAVGVARGVDGGVATVVEEGVAGGMAFEGEARLAGDDSLRPRFGEGDSIVKSLSARGERGTTLGGGINFCA